MHTVELKYRNQFRKDLEREYLINLSALEQDPINLNNSLISICLDCFAKPPGWRSHTFPGNQLAVRKFPQCLMLASCDSFSHPALVVAGIWDMSEYPLSTFIVSIFSHKSYFLVLLLLQIVVPPLCAWFHL